MITGRDLSLAGQAATLQAFHVLKTYLRPEARLQFAEGLPDPQRQVLERFIRELGLRGVRLTGDPAGAGTQVQVCVFEPSIGGKPVVSGPAGTLQLPHAGPFLLAEALAWALGAAP